MTQGMQSQCWRCTSQNSSSTMHASGTRRHNEAPLTRMQLTHSFYLQAAATIHFMQPYLATVCWPQHAGIGFSMLDGAPHLQHLEYDISYKTTSIVALQLGTLRQPCRAARLSQMPALRTTSASCMFPCATHSTTGKIISTRGTLLYHQLMFRFAGSPITITPHQWLWFLVCMWMVEGL